MSDNLREKADKLLALREDLYEMHFHKVDREWLIDAMVDFALNYNMRAFELPNSSPNAKRILDALRDFRDSLTDEEKEKMFHDVEEIETNILTDNEIDKIAKEYVLYNESKRNWVVEGMKLYREKISKK